jgi:hypothetical protein
VGDPARILLCPPGTKQTQNDLNRVVLCVAPPVEHGICKPQFTQT